MEATLRKCLCGWWCFYIYMQRTQADLSTIWLTSNTDYNWNNPWWFVIGLMMVSLRFDKVDPFDKKIYVSVLCLVRRLHARSSSTVIHQRAATGRTPDVNPFQLLEFFFFFKRTMSHLRSATILTVCRGVKVVGFEHLKGFAKVKLANPFILI